jgi:hypothetical protein
MQVSWKHDHTEFTKPLTVEQKIELFYEQIANGGMTFETTLGPRSYHVPAIEHSGFAVLHICLSYFELIGSIIAPQLKSGKAFVEGVKHVFPSLFMSPVDGEILAKHLYKGGRCGLYHAARTNQHVGLGSPPRGEAIAYYAQTNSITISPERLPPALKDHLERFRTQLLKPTEALLRAQFEKRFDEDFV